MRLDDIRDDTGTLPTHAWPGLYPLYYFDGYGSVLCPKCANASDRDEGELSSFKPCTYDVNWEDPDLFCEHCNARIESAYAEED